MNANATEAAIVINIVIVSADVKRGEKVFNAYMIFAPFVLIVGVLVGDWLGSAVLSLCSSVFNRNEWALPHRVMRAL